MNEGQSVMFLSHIFTVPVRVKRLSSNETSGMRFQGHHFIRQALLGCCRPLANAHGSTAYWLNTALVLLVICSTLAVLYFTSGIRKPRNQPDILLDQKEVSSPAQRYRIPIPAKKSVQSDSGLSSEAVVHEAPAEEYYKFLLEAIGNPATTPFERNDANVRLGGPVRDAGQANGSYPEETEKPPVEEIERSDSTADREDVDLRSQVDEKPGAQGITPGPDVAVKTEKGSSRNADKASRHVGGETGKRLFVKVNVGNVREGPTTLSKIKFRVERGDSVTVTGKRGGWFSVRLDDGRSGWAYHTLLTDSIVPQEAMVRATKEIKAIRSEVVARDVAKVIFELNGPFPPKTMIVEGEKPRVVCDFIDAGLASDIGDSIEINNGIIEKIRTGIHKWPRSKVRVVLDLVPELNYKIDQFFFDKENHYVLVVKAKE